MRKTYEKGFEEEGNDLALVNDADAYNTSKMCPRCGSKVSDHQGQYRKRVCKACSAKEGIYFTFDRDVGAAVNFCTIDDFRMDPSNARRSTRSHLEDPRARMRKKRRRRRTTRRRMAQQHCERNEDADANDDKTEEAEAKCAARQRSAEAHAQDQSGDRRGGQMQRRISEKSKTKNRALRKEEQEGDGRGELGKVAKRRKRTRSTSPQRRKSARLVAKINPEKEMRPKKRL